jgi:hypothetical protein
MNAHLLFFHNWENEIKKSQNGKIWQVAKSMKFTCSLKNGLLEQNK